MRTTNAITSAGTQGMKKTGERRSQDQTVHRYEPRGEKPSQEQLHNRMQIVGYEPGKMETYVSTYHHPDGHRVTMQHSDGRVSALEHRTVGERNHVESTPGTRKGKPRTLASRPASRNPLRR